MKQICMVSGILLLVCGILVAVVFGSLADKLKPREVKYGYIQDGKYTFYDSDTIGDEEGSDTADAVQGAGVVAAVVGGILLVVSLCMKKPTPIVY